MLSVSCRGRNGHQMTLKIYITGFIWPVIIEKRS